MKPNDKKRSWQRAFFYKGTTGSNTITATSGAGNVVVSVPSGIAARIHASTGMGKVIVASRFSQIDKNTYLSPDYDPLPGLDSLRDQQADDTCTYRRYGVIYRDIST